MRTETVEKTYYTFDELSDKAKERARDWWRQCESADFDSEYVIDDAQQVAAILGIEFDSNAVKLMGGGVRYEPAVYWSGFSTQGDGACFEGRYRYNKGASKRIREYAPNDERLHIIADNLQATQKMYFYGIAASMKHSGHYYHEYCMDIDVDHATRDYDLHEATDVITESMRDFARWIYRQLESEYDYWMSDECVDESITINEYEFDESGNIA